MAFSLSKSEEKLMAFLWDQNTPLSVPEMEELCEKQTWGEHYLRVMLKSLENKGAVECCSFEQRGKQYARRFRCTVTKEEYYVQLAEKGGANLNGVFRATAVAMTKKADKESQEELLKKLEEIMEEYRTRDDGEE